MSIVYGSGRGPASWPATDSHDPNSKRYYRIDYRPPVWTANTPMVLNVNVVVPTVDNGCMYECSSGGRTAFLEPTTWPTIEDGTVTDNDVEWTCVPRTSVLRSGDVITASTWTGDDGCLFDNPSIVDQIATKVRLYGVPGNVDSVTITNHITILRVNGDIEELDRSIILPVLAT